MYMERTSTAPTRSKDLASAWSQVATVVAAVDASLGRWLMENHQLGLTEYRALLLLSRAEDRELRLNHLASRVGLNQSSVTRLVGRLEAKRLVYRDTCPDDGRGVYAVLSDAGAAAVQAIREPYEATIERVLRTARDHYPHLDLNELDAAFGAVSELVT